MFRIDFYKLVLLITALLAAIIVALIQPLFFTLENLTNVAGQAAPVVIFAIAQMVPILTRGLDLSQGGVVVSTSVAFALLAQHLGTGTGAVLSTLVGLSVGTINGALIAGIDISPFVVTFGTESILQGIALLAANGQPISLVPANFSSLFYARVLHIPVPVLVAAVLALLMWFVLEKMLIGRRVVAVGSNPRAAYLSGMPVKVTLVAAYAMSGMLTSIGSVLLSARISSGHPTAGADTALQAVAAAVIGGVSLFGGRGTVGGTVLGAIFLSLLSNALNLLNVSSFLQLVAAGSMIIIAVVADRFRFGPKTPLGMKS